MLLKRVYDVTFAACALLLLSPFLLLVGLIISVEDGGPVFFRQKRLGLDGQPFELWKFRTMIEGADEHLAEDGSVTRSRITRVGKWLRYFSLDELPQLINIIRGEMSIVGPRPVLPDHWARYSEHQRRRFGMRPGITGLAQISGRNTLAWSKRIEFDVMYIENFSLLLDVGILIKTVPAVLLRRGVVLDRNPGQVDDLEPLRSSERYGNPRTDPDPAPRFRKSVRDESFLAEMNRSLAGLEHSLCEQSPSPRPTLFVLGLPRSGTTLVTQVLASSTTMGFVSNLAASFWDTPIVGTLLARRLAPHDWKSSYRSQFGRTEGAVEPHEFGYFWAKHLGYSDLSEPDDRQRRKIDWQLLREILWNLCAVHDAPMFFKNVLLNWHALELHDQVPESCFVWIKRDEIDVARSILKMREEFMGSRDKWVSAKPARYDHLRDRDCWDQIAGQIVYLERALSAQWSRLQPDRRVELAFDDFLGQPTRARDAIVEMLRENGARIEPTVQRVDSFRPAERGSRMLEHDQRLQESLSRLNREAACEAA